MLVSKTVQLLTFVLGSEVYAIDVFRIREVLDWVGVTKLPRTPDWICGVLNLRGSVLPVVDMKMRLGMGTTEHTRSTCILVLELAIDGEHTVAGVLVDAVRAVIEIAPQEIEPPPRFGAKLSTHYVRGIGRQESGIFIVLDVEKLFSGGQLDDILGAKDESSPEVELVT